MLLHRVLRRPVVLAYHGVGRVDDGDDPHRLVLEPSLLDEQLRWLVDQGYRFTTAEALLDETGPDRRPRRGTAVLTFDDGWLDAATTVVPLLQRLGLVASFYVCPGWFGGDHPLVSGSAARLLAQRDLEGLVGAGMEVASHSMLHRDLRTLGRDELLDDLRTSKEEVERATGRPCRTFAYPYGVYDDGVEGAVGEAGYDLAFAWVPGRWRATAAPRLAAPPRHGARRLALKVLGIKRPGP